MASDADRYCANCRTLIPPRAEVCPACGTYAGDVYDGRPLRPSGRRVAGGGWGGGWGGGRWVLVLVVLIGAGGVAWWTMNRPALPRPDTGPIRVVGDRPGGARRPAGAAISEPEAILTLRHYFAAQEHPIKSQCVAVMSKGYSNGYYSFNVVDSCKRASLGRWRVEAKTRAVSQ
ncbi:MAG TPA: zinc ribbon domain-containing protein [Thermoanaerobaculia bacterium]